MRTAPIVLLPLATLATAGCLQRRIHITSNPPGATVWLNDVEVGQTPLDADFLHYGVYDVRVRKDGYEPITTERHARAPVYEWAPIDLLAEAVPAPIETVVRWHFDLEPQHPLDEAARGLLLNRARTMRDEIGPPPEEPPPASPSGSPEPAPPPP